MLIERRCRATLTIIDPPRQPDSTTRRGRGGSVRHMIFNNPFAELSASIAPIVMQTYVVIMIVLVAGGTLYDIVHKRSAKYFFNTWRDSNIQGTQPVGVVQKVSLAIQTAVVEGLTSGEFCNARRRIAHLLTMYGFLAYV